MLCRWDKAPPLILPAASTGSSLGPQRQLCQVLSSGDSALSWGHPCSQPAQIQQDLSLLQVAVAQQQLLSCPATLGWWWQLCSTIASLTLGWPLCLTTLVPNLRGPRQHLKCQKEKKGESFKHRRLWEARQLLTARWETKNGKLDTVQLLLPSLQLSGKESSKIDSCGKPDWWFSLMGWDTQGQMWKMLFKWLVDTDEF